jgi:hypothetical protein
MVVERDFPDVVAPGEEQGGVSLGRLAPGVVAGFLLVIVQALALERALLVDASLRARAGRIALVDVCVTGKYGTDALIPGMILGKGAPEGICLSIRGLGTLILVQIVLFGIKRDS